VRPPAAAALLAAGLALAAPSAAAPAGGAESAGAPAVEEAPLLERRGARLRLAGMPPVIAAAEVREHLETGLTTTFAFEVTARDGARGKAEGGARAAVRYDLWDEVYLVSALGADGRVERRRLDSFDRLLEWWRGLALALLDAPELDPAGPWQVRIGVSLVPFSQAEQDDAQRWLTRSLEGASGSATEELAAAGEDGAPPLGALLDLLAVTSIARRSLRRWEWRLAVGPGGR
jgi:hypothetical protein